MRLSWLLLAIGILLIIFLPEYPGASPQPQNISWVCFGSSCFKVELALTPEQQAMGLMNRTHLDADKGMLFIFSQDGIYPFWMKNTLIPLDMIWMGSGGRVVFIAKDEQPCGPLECPAINPEVPARYVLEVNAGAAERIGLVEGEKIEIEISA
jgi:uncharacterized membrane protein (UPF0127 family)